MRSIALVSGLVLGLFATTSFAQSAVNSSVVFKSESAGLVIKYSLVELEDGNWDFVDDIRSCSQGPDGMVICTTVIPVKFSGVSLTLLDGPQIPERVVYNIGDTGYTLVRRTANGPATFEICFQDRCTPVKAEVSLR
jgi:hypothetical protein